MNSLIFRFPTYSLSDRRFMIWRALNPTNVLRGMAGVLAISLMSCQSTAISVPTQSPTQTIVPFIPTTAIKDAQAAPPNTPLALKGAVGAIVPLVDGHAYELQDGTSKIWVLTTANSPTKGQEITIKGTLRFKSIPLNGKEQGGMYIEQN